MNRPGYELKGVFHSLSAELKGDIHVLRNELKDDINRLERMEAGFKEQLKLLILLMQGFSSLLITVVKFLYFSGLMFRTVFYFILSLVGILAHPLLQAQNPAEASFRFWLRNKQGKVLMNRSITVKVSLVSEKNDQSFFSENQQLRTNGEGMISFLPGTGFTEVLEIARTQTNSVFLKADADTSGKELFDYALLFMPMPGISSPGKVRNELRISASGDTLFLESGQYRIIPGISTAKPRERGWKGSDCHTCGAKDIHNPELEYGMVRDYDGNEYKTIAIGGQVWMAENLKSAHFQNGDIIPYIPGRLDWITAVSPGYCWYENDMTENECPYGKLYNWYAAVDPRNICPVGWHVPVPGDWNQLQDFLGGRGAAVEKLKTKGNRYFNNLNFSGNNISGFSAIPTGFRGMNGKSHGKKWWGIFWSSSSFDREWGNAYTLFALDVVLVQKKFFSQPESVAISGSDAADKNLGLGVRCVRD